MEQWFERLTELQRDFAVNISTESLGVVASVLISIGVASWLDGRRDKAVFRNRVLAYVRQLDHMIEFLSMTVPSAKLYDHERVERPYAVEITRYWVTTDFNEQTETIRDHARNIVVDYAQYVDRDISRKIRGIRSLLQNTFACIRLRSLQFQANISDAVPVEQIVDEHVDWLVSHLIRLRTFRDEFAKAFRVRVDPPPIDEAQVRSDWTRLFRTWVPEAIEEVRADEG